ncbi:MAG: DUF4912 domain-containing protein [Verrucomicrobia bacterium]|nr:DUF4912 domain-containing protein [Verrucomicrobiota bacterium]MBV9659111.1 DUF4912 domain-containing protein [Verrucomicrobiota bacterium]
MSESLPTPADSATAASKAAGQSSPSASGTSFRVSQEPVTTGAQAATGAPSPAPAYEYLGELPSSYGAPTVYLVAYDPHRLFTYWDLDWEKLPAGSSVAVRVLSVHDAAAAAEESRVDISPGDAGRYLPVQRLGGTYVVELGTGGGGSRPWNVLAASEPVTLPPANMAAEVRETQFATLPFHVSFQKLTDLLRTAIDLGETQGGLTGTLSRLQRGSGALAQGAGALRNALGDLSHEQRRDLATLFGWSPTSGGWGSESVISSGGWSSGGWSSAEGGESSGSGGFGGAVSALGAVGAGGSESLSSAGISSFYSSALGAGGSESLSSVIAMLLSAAPSSGGGSSAEFFRQLASLGASSLGGSSEVQAFFSAALLAAAGGPGGSESLASGAHFSAAVSGGAGGSESLSSGALLGKGPSSEAWRFAARGASSSGGVPAGAGASDRFGPGGGGGSEVKARERAERFLRAITSSVDVLGSAFSPARAWGTGGYSSTGRSAGRW